MVALRSIGEELPNINREKGRTERLKVDGNLAAARATASKINAALEEERPTPFSFQRIGVKDCISVFLSYCENVQGLSTPTIDRYRAALSHFVEFAERAEIKTVDQVGEGTIEEFIKYMREKTRTRNGSKQGQRRSYKTKGIKFILSTCRTAFNYAKKRRHLPPYTENPFPAFPIDNLRERDQEETPMLTIEEQQRFFEACDDWQFGIFCVLTTYGLRVGELTHLLISDVDLDQNVFHIRSKPDLFWHVKTNTERSLPIVPELKPLFAERIGGRAEGFVFLNERFFNGDMKPKRAFASAAEFFAHVRRLADEKRTQGVTSEKALQQAIAPFLSAMGMIPEKRIRQEFMKLTKKIGRQEVTKAYSLRHTFATGAQECGGNPFVV